MIVIKRDDTKVVFDKDKIIKAVLKAFYEVDKEETSYAQEKAQNIANQIESVVNSKKEITVEEIQNMVEQKLMQSNRKDVAKTYILYRNNRTLARESKSQLSKELRKKLMAIDIENQNANVDEKSFGGRMGAVTSAVTKKYALDHCMSKKSKMNHLNNRIYIHDLDHYAVGDHNCLSIPFDDLLANGFNTRQTDVRPANSIGTAMQLVAVIFQLQSLMQFGKKLCRIKTL